MATTYQAISGAGKTFKDWPEMVGNIIPYIGGEEEKSEKEPLRIWGHIDDEKKEIVPAASPVITCQCIRVPVLNGHTAAVFVKFKKKPTKEQLIEALRNYSGVPQELRSSKCSKAVHPVFRGGQQTTDFLGCQLRERYGNLCRTSERGHRL